MISNKIKQKRSDKGLSQEELANRLCVVRQTVSKWETGLSVPDSEMIVRLAAVLDTTTSELLEEETQQAMPKSNSIKVWTIILLVLGSPVWLSIGLSAAAVVLSLYVSLWAVIVSFWSVFASFIGCALGGIVAGVVFMCKANLLVGIATFGAAIACAGFSIFAFYGCYYATKYIIIFINKIVVWIKNHFINKEVA